MLLKDNQYIESSLKDLKIEPETVRHIKTNSESSFTSTGEKLDAHWPIFDKFQKTGFGSIIRATMTSSSLYVKMSILFNYR